MTDTSMPPMGSTRTRIIDALMALLAEQPFERIGLADVAAKAGVTLADMRGEFSSLLGILAAHMKDTDRKVLAGGDADMAGESVREKLLDILMRRLDVLAPHKAAIKSLIKSSSRNPALAMALNGLGVKSQAWMMSAAGINVRGPKGAIRAQGLNLLFARVVCTWVNDDDPGHARTMAALDRELARGARFAGFLDDLFCIPQALCGGSRRWRARRKPAAEDDVVAI